MSVLVDERFAGSWDDLRAARAATTLPLLAKGFFSTPEHLGRRATPGADAALLHPARPRRRRRARAACATARALGLDTLVEAHDADELARAVALDAPVIGINARDLSTFAIDRARPARAARARAARPDRDRRERRSRRARRRPPPSSRARTRSSSARR